jgi:hypothetical protein
MAKRLKTLVRRHRQDLVWGVGKASRLVNLGGAVLSRLLVFIPSLLVGIDGTRRIAARSARTAIHRLADQLVRRIQLHQPAQRHLHRRIAGQPRVQRMVVDLAGIHLLLEPGLQPHLPQTPQIARPRSIGEPLQHQHQLHIAWDGCGFRRWMFLQHHRLRGQRTFLRRVVRHRRLWRLCVWLLIWLGFLWLRSCCTRCHLLSGQAGREAGLQHQQSRRECPKCARAGQELPEQSHMPSP